MLFDVDGPPSPNPVLWDVHLPALVRYPIVMDDGRDLLKLMFQHYASYHHHKEVMAYSIFALEGAFFLGLFLLGTWPPSVQSMPPQLLGTIFVMTWVLFHTALRFQLRNRRLAAIKTAAYLDALLQDEAIRFDRASVEPFRAHAVDEVVDAYLLPVRSTMRAADVATDALGDGQMIAPGSPDAAAYHELRHRRAAQVSWTKYALPMEWIATVGSFLMLCIALVRVAAT